MTATQRKILYGFLLIGNGALAYASQQGLVPPACTELVHGASFVLSMLMKEFHAEEEPE